jgi:hypothetical protein
MPLRSLLILGIFVANDLRADWYWIEGEKPAKSSMNRHPWWYDQVKRGEFSGGDFISNFNDDKPGEAQYSVTVKKAGKYQLWVRANPLRAKLAYRLGEGSWTPIDLERNQFDNLNVAGDGKPDLRFLAWVDAGEISVKTGANRIAFRMDGGMHNHGYLDCFVLTNEPFSPKGKRKPNAAETAGALDEAKGWFPFKPSREFSPGSVIDLRRLNEKFAGEHGRIVAKGSSFAREGDGKEVRFWAVNRGPHRVAFEELQHEARLLAKYGVNMVRWHGKVFTDDGEPDMKAVAFAQDVVAAMKAEGIYTHLSIYFPLWMTPKPDSWLEGYDGKKHPFAALMFNEKFQNKYRSWWKALLTAPSQRSGKPLIDEPAVFGAEIQNEDSFFFWTFSDKNIPDVQLRILEAKFGHWLKTKHGSIEKAFAAWKVRPSGRDAVADGRVAFRPLWNIANQKTARDKDTVEFLTLTQRGFYEKEIAHLRSLGFKGLVCCSNWVTASPEVLTPLEKYTYAVGDFIDRHGYFSCNHKGENAEWSIRVGHTFAHRSALRFEPEVPGKPKLFSHPVMDPTYNGKPSMISETTFTRPSRFRTEAPIFYAAYGAMQGTDAIVHFAFDGPNWSVKPNFWMQQWTLASPTMMGQFPAAALVFREGLVPEGDLYQNIPLLVANLYQLKGTPLPQDAALDELRLVDVPNQGRSDGTRTLYDPLTYFVGQNHVRFIESGGFRYDSNLPDDNINRRERHVSSYAGLKLDYANGLLIIDTPKAQAIVGDLSSKTSHKTSLLECSSKLDNACCLLVSLDDKPLKNAARLLLQVMSEEKPTDFRTEALEAGKHRIANTGRDPWLVKEIEGKVTFKAADAANSKITKLDLNGVKVGAATNGPELTFDPRTVYYLIERP